MSDTTKAAGVTSRNCWICGEDIKLPQSYGKGISGFFHWTCYDRMYPANREVVGAPDYKALCQLAARVILQHMNDEDHEMSLAGLYAKLTEHEL
jgi:hypothetical protein